ncbi:MAG: hypothetical protein ABSF50_20735 [Burkholderiaceae bacterium]
MTGKHRVWLTALLALIASEGQNVQAENGSASDESVVTFSFAVVAEAPFGAAVEPAFSDVLRAIDSSNAAFTIDLGDIKGLDEPCSDALFETRKALFDAARKPVVVLPGFNDWIACSQQTDTGFDALEWLGRLRELFDGSEVSLGQEPMTVARQSGMRRFRDYSENVRWQYGRILFVGLNVAGVNNDFRLAAGRNGEFEDRVIANRAWLERAFKIAEMHKLPGVVVAIQGDPEFQKPIRPPDRRLNRRDGYYEFKQLIRELVQHYHGEVLLLHGGVNASKGDEPLSDAQGKPIRNLVRVESFGSPNVRRWVHVEVDARKARVFSVRFEDATASAPPAGEPPVPSSAPGSDSDRP